MTFKKIVVATDGSANANRAVRTAGEVAARYEAEVFILHTVLEGPIPDALLQWARVEHLVEDDPQLLPQWPGYGNLGVIGPRQPKVAYDVRVQLGRAILDYAKTHAREAGAQKITEVIDEGDAASAVVALVRREQANLAVVGTRGLGTLEGALIGSTSHKLIAQHICPVLAVP